eukprot:scaffold18777_cov40-Attheya_sp.AAC.1
MGLVKGSHYRRIHARIPATDSPNYMRTGKALLSHMNSRCYLNTDAIDVGVKHNLTHVDGVSARCQNVRAHRANRRARYGYCQSEIPEVPFLMTYSRSSV